MATGSRSSSERHRVDEFYKKRREMLYSYPASRPFGLSRYRPFTALVEAKNSLKKLPMTCCPNKQEIHRWFLTEKLLQPSGELIPDERNIMAQSTIFVDTNTKFYDMVEDLQLQSEIGFSLLRSSNHGYQGRYCCLLQFSTWKQDYVLDALEMVAYIPQLRSILQSTDILKIGQEITEDLKTLQLDYQIYPLNMVDVQIVHEAITGTNNVAFPKLCQGYILLTYRNAQEGQFLDWNKRPLPPSMISYAMSQSHLLLRVWGKMKQELHKKKIDQSVWIPKCKTLLLQRFDFHVHPTATEEARFFKVPRNKLPIFELLHEWRDVTARKLDLPPHQIFDSSKLATTASAETVEWSVFKGMTLIKDEDKFAFQVAFSRGRSQSRPTLPIPKPQQDPPTSPTTVSEQQMELEFEEISDDELVCDAPMTSIVPTSTISTSNVCAKSEPNQTCYKCYLSGPGYKGTKCPYRQPEARTPEVKAMISRNLKEFKRLQPMVWWHHQRNKGNKYAATLQKRLQQRL